MKYCLVWLFIIFIFPFCKIFSNTNYQYAWIDFPKCPLNLFLECKTKTLDAIHEQVQIYHSIPKSEFSFLKERIQCLLELEKMLKEVSLQSTKSYEIQFFLEMSDIARKKKWYLEKIMDFYTHADVYPRMECELTNYQDLFDKSLVPIPLHNKMLYFPKKSAHWGLFWLEYQDPCHRKLDPYYMEWLDRKNKNNNLPDFFLWLEDQVVPFYCPAVEYFDEEKCDSFGVIAKNGKLYFDNTNSLLHSRLGVMDYMFVFDLQGKLFVLPQKDPNTMCHTSLTHGRPVLGAGSLIVEHGIIQEIISDSGHYLPKKQSLEQVVKLFNNIGIELIDNVKITFFELPQGFSYDTYGEWRKING